MRLSEERYDNPAYRDIKNSVTTQHPYRKLLVNKA